MNSRIKGFDGIRALAVLGVFVHHRLTESLIGIGSAGVWVFFALSGYLIIDILHRRRKSIESGSSGFCRELLRFHYHRVLRIFPIYYLVLALAVLWWLVFRNNGNVAGLGWYLTYTTNFWIGFVAKEWPGSFSHLWSLAVEQQFYLLVAPLLLGASSGRHRAILLGALFLALLSLFFMSIRDYGPKALYTFSLQNFGFMALGGLLALAKGETVLPNKWANVSVAVSIIGFALLSLGRYPDGMAISFELRFVMGIGFCGMLLAYVVENQQSALVRFLERPALVLLGQMSYGIYLYHNFVPNTGGNFALRLVGIQNAPAVGHVIGACFCLAATLFVSYFSWRYVESPILKLKNKGRSAAPLSAAPNPSVIV